MKPLFISSEDWVMFPSFFFWTAVFRDWPILRSFSWIFLATPANLLLFFIVAKFWRENILSNRKNDIFSFVYHFESTTKLWLFEINNHSQCAQSTENEETSRNINISTFVSLVHTFSVAGNLFVFPAQPRYREGKSSSIFLSARKMPFLTEKIHLSIHFFPQRVQFSIFWRENLGLIRRQWTSQCLFSRRHKKNENNRKQKFFDS